MFAVDRKEVIKLAEQLAGLHGNMTDANGIKVSFRAQPDQYIAAIMAALVAISDGDSIGYQGDTHLGGKDYSQALSLKDPATIRESVARSAGFNGA